MDEQRKLELTLCGMLPYGLEMQFEGTGGRIITLQNITFSSLGTAISVGYGGMWLKESRFKPILHSLSKLTENVLDDENDHFYKLNLELCDILETSDCENFVKSIYEGKYYGLGVAKTLIAMEWLKENHFNIYNLSPESYIEKQNENNFPPTPIEGKIFSGETE